MPCISYRSRKRFAGSSESPKAGWVAIRSYFYPRWGKLASLRTWGMERTGFRVYHLWNAGEFIAYLSSHDFWVTEHTLLGGRVLPLCYVAGRK